MHPGFHAENNLFLGRPKLCGVLIPSQSFLLGYVAASLVAEAVLGLICELCARLWQPSEYCVCCGGSWGNSCCICSIWYYRDCTQPTCTGCADVPEGGTAASKSSCALQHQNQLPTHLWTSLCLSLLLVPPAMVPLPWLWWRTPQPWSWRWHQLFHDATCTSSVTYKSCL